MKLKLLSLLLIRVQASCLSDAIPPANRRNLENPITRESYPLGMWLNGWAAASVVHEVAAIILSEKIGFNVTTIGTGTATVDAFYAITEVRHSNKNRRSRL